MKALLVALCLPVALLAAEPSARKPNVVVMVGDDMGYADLGIHGCKDIPTPHLDSLAKNGIRCTSGYVSATYCSPTRAALLTGRYQQRFGHEFNPGPSPDAAFGLPLSERTLADHFAAAGYKTGWVGKWHLGARPEFTPPRRGFNEAFGFMGGAHRYLPGATGQAAGIFRNGERVEEPEYLTDAFAREALAFIDRHKAAPFFLYLAFNAVHTPLQATKKYLERFAGIADQRRKAYAAMMSAMDDAVGRVLEKLRAAGLEEQTIVFFISDNGGPPANASNNGPLRGHKAQTWEGGIRVPWLVQWKGNLPAGQTFDHPVIQLDIAPTAFAACRLEKPVSAQWEGINLLPFLKGEEKAAPSRGLFWRFGQQMAARQGDWKLVQAPGSNGRELYNLKDDIGEKNNLASTQPEKLKELEVAWAGWDKENIAPKWGQPNQRAAQPDNEERRQRRQQRRQDRRNQETKDPPSQPPPAR